MPESVLQPRPLESALFGQTIHACAVTTPAEVEAALSAAESLGSALLVLRAPASSLAAMQRVEAAGGRLCDILLTYARSVHRDGADTPGPQPGTRIRTGGAEDSEALRAVAARAFKGFGGHWHADTRLEPHLASRLYEDWASDLAKAAGTDVRLLVAEDSVGQVTGFLATAVDGGGIWHVPLTAVDPDYRGRGILSALLGAALRDAAESGATEFRYETQVENRPALRVIARHGFVLQSARLTLHLWTEHT